MKRIIRAGTLLASATALAGALLLDSPAHAADEGIADQHNTSANILWSGSQSKVPIMHQTFRAGVTGSLVRVSAFLKRNALLTEGAVVAVFTTDSQGRPNNLGTPLAEAIAVNGALLENPGQNVIFSFNRPAQLTAGRLYSISVMSESSNYSANHLVMWAEADLPDSFASGQSCFYDTDTEITHPTVNCRAGYDFLFSTYMVPIPVTPVGSMSKNYVALPNTGFDTPLVVALALIAMSVGSALLIARRVERR